MKKIQQYIRVPKVVQAIQFTPELVIAGSGFELPERWKGRINADQEKKDNKATTFVRVTTIKHGCQIARKGDWIVEHEDWDLEVMSDLRFNNNFAEAK